MFRGGRVVLVSSQRLRDDEAHDHHADPTGDPRGVAALHAAAGGVLCPREGDPVLLRRSLRLRVFGSRGDPVIRKALDHGEVSHG